jgi:phage gpG-like protein
MATVQIKTEAGQVITSLSAFSMFLQNKQSLLEVIGAGQLVSIYRTFAEEGSPSGSWAPLAESTRKRYKRDGHKLLIKSGNLRNSIKAVVAGNSVTIGTGVVYAAVQQFGSRDRGSIGYGPRTKAMDDAKVKVGEHDRESFRGPRVKYGRVTIVDKNGRTRRVWMRRAGPIERRVGKVSAHERHQNIPARPYLVFRPEDPERIEQEVRTWVSEQANAAGLETS